MQDLDKKLEEYSKSDMYPFHMPGHKRQNMKLPNPYEIDITEIDGFDNLHHAEGVIKDAQDLAARLYQSRRTYYLVNGSTCGILAGISSALRRGERILMARNVHKAVYHAVYLKQLSTTYLYPELTSFGVQGAIKPQDVEDALLQNPDIRAVMITSPTYEGVVSDVAAIAKIAHQHRVPLIVDEAHGAHLGFHPYFPESAVHLGADIVIQSMHKMLPSLTQTALLHLNSEYITENEVEKYLDIYETSSPSYVLMAGMHQCIRMMCENRNTMFAAYESKLQSFYQEVKMLRHIHVIQKEDMKKEVYDWDPSKIIISVKDTNFSGKELYEILLNKYHLQMEMVSGYYVLGMTSMMDCDEGFERLILALQELDNVIGTEKKADAVQFMERLYGKRSRQMEAYQAMELPTIQRDFEYASGRMAASFVYLYPPGVPVIVPGETIDGTLLSMLKQCGEMGLQVDGGIDMQKQRINVVNF